MLGDRGSVSTLALVLGKERESLSLREISVCILQTPNLVRGSYLSSLPPSLVTLEILLHADHDISGG